MLTPQEIQDKKFEKAAFGGYNMGQIDEFLDEVLNDYSSLYKENAALKAKMRVLVDKIEEYRAVDEELRKTLYNAQISAKDTVSRAQSEAERILRDARGEAARHVDDLKQETAEEEARLAAAKRNSVIYAERIRKAMEQSMSNLEQVLALSQPDEKDADPAQEPVQPLEPAVQPEEKHAEQDDLQATRVRGEEALRAAIAAATANTVKEQPRGEFVRRDEPVQAHELFRKEEPVKKQEPASVSAEGLELSAEPEEDSEFAPDPKSDTARIYGDSPFTPKPRFNFDDLRFGKNFDENADDDKE